MNSLRTRWLLLEETALFFFNIAVFETQESKYANFYRMQIRMNCAHILKSNKRREPDLTEPRPSQSVELSFPLRSTNVLRLPPSVIITLSQSEANVF